MINNISRRSILLSLAALPVPGLSAACNAAAAVEATDASTLRQPGDTNDGPAIARALSTGKPVRLPAGRGSGERGAYIVDMLQLPAGATLSGDGSATVVRSSSPRIASVFVVASIPPATTGGISIRNLTLEGYVEDAGFTEHHNLLNVSGVSDFLVENVLFRGFASDGIYIGAEYLGNGHAPSARQPCVNERIVIRNCSFDGINNDNRNAISVTGGKDVSIENCRFTRCSRPNMPGPIDFEADALPFYVFERISVKGCSFDNCGGNVAQIGVVVPAIVRFLPRNISISGNRFSNYRGNGSDVAITVHRPASSAMPDMGISITDNIGVNGRAGVRLYSGKGIVVRNNQWIGYPGQSFIGYNSPEDGCINVHVSDRFERCGSLDGVALGLYNASSVDITDCTFTNCGNGHPDSACILLGAGRSNDINLSGNDFRNNPGTRMPLRRAVGHILMRPLNVLDGNLLAAGQRLAG